MKPQATGRGIFVQPSAKKAKHNLADLRGMLKYEGPPISLEELCKPIDLGKANRGEDNNP